MCLVQLDFSAPNEYNELPHVAESNETHIVASILMDSFPTVYNGEKFRQTYLFQNSWSVSSLHHV